MVELDPWQKFQNVMTNGAAAAATAEAIASQLPGRANGLADTYRHILISAELYRSGQSGILLNLHKLDRVFGFETTNTAQDFYMQAVYLPDIRRLYA